VFKKGKKPHSEAMKNGKKIQVASLHHLFYSSCFTFLEFPEASGRAILSVFRASTRLK